MPPLSKAILLQHGAEGQEKLLETVRPWHQAYCDRHGIEYRTSTERIVPKRAAAWDKVTLIATALQENYEFVFWLDGDAVVVEPEVDLRDALENGAELGMVDYDRGGTYRRWNSGAMYIRHTGGCQVFFQLLEQSWPGPGHHEELEVNRLLEHMGEYMNFAALSDKWNWGARVNDGSWPVVLGFHGQADAAAKVEMAVTHLRGVYGV